MEQSFFHQVQAVLESFVLDVSGTMHSNAHQRGIKVWYDDATKEHYEAQLIRGDGKEMLEVGFHVEYPKVEKNEAILQRLLATEKGWRRTLGIEPIAGVFLGVERWRRVSEIWEETDADDVDAAIEIAARLADYISVFEHLRRA